jgi:hypothetical protein
MQEITKGIAMTDDERAVYKSNGRLQLVVIEFFDACRDRIKNFKILKVLIMEDYVSIKYSHDTSDS